MAEFLGFLKNGAQGLLGPSSSNFWTLIPNLRSVFRYFQNLRLFQPFLAKMAEFLESMGNGNLKFLRPPRNNFWMLNPNLNLVLRNSQNFQPFLEIFSRNG